ncbi:hypothetical protein [Parvibium lacunae]|uniref:Uncharacterized protein n=1 Tax=Parvibium lacunae TaxID=1888893 RepID=A0A368L5A2_9BURK|nr:hypothetical protein [Parvibium lacunae]RCS58653.1 hypothetical protein DU000_07590 [Parvibium lacunae]
MTNKLTHDQSENPAPQAFIDELKAAGVAIKNEPVLRQRLAEVNRWKYAFMTLAANGQAIGIRFLQRGNQCDSAKLHAAFDHYALPAKAETLFKAHLATV